MTDSNLQDRTISIKRTFKAPISLVWEAWTQAAHIAHWWGPKGMKVNVVEHDFRVDGKWQYSMMMPDGKEFISEGQYTEIVPQKKIVTTGDFRPMTFGVILEYLFEAAGEETHFTLNVIHPTAEYALQQEKMGIYNGWGSVFDRLEAFLAGQSA